jgi:hypothetical protein
MKGSTVKFADGDVVQFEGRYPKVVAYEAANLIHALRMIPDHLVEFRELTTEEKAMGEGARIARFRERIAAERARA